MTPEPRAPAQAYPPAVEATVLAFIALTGATALVAALGAIASVGEADPWYAALKKAPGTPPGLVIAIVWPTLYALMAIGACLVWREGGGWKRTDNALGLYFLQLAANLGWSYLFFRYHLPAAALIDIAGLFILVAMMIRAFGEHSRIAALIQYPYLAWLGFAAYLNAWVVFAG